MNVSDNQKNTPSSQAKDATSTQHSAKHTNTYITSPHQIDMRTSQLPTLLEEESSDLKSPDPAPMVREEADGKDEAAEVNVCDTLKQTNIHQ